MKTLLYLCLLTCTGIALADEASTFELKRKSSFNVEPSERNPFWPIGFKPAPKFAKSGPEHAGPAIPPSARNCISISSKPIAVNCSMQA